jgi:hypothetical protein
MTMDALSPESRALYELPCMESKEEYESRFLECKKELLDAVKVFVDDTTGQISDINATVDETRFQMSADLQAAKASISVELESSKTTLSSEIVGLAKTLDQALCSNPSAMALPPLPRRVTLTPPARIGVARNMSTGEILMLRTWIPRTHVLNSTKILLPLVSITLPVILVLIQ